MGAGKPAFRANSGSACSGLRSPQSRYSSACCRPTAYVASQSGARSGGATVVDAPRSPPKPPSPRTKIEDRTRHSSVPSSERATPSCQITAAVPLSHTSLIRVLSLEAPDVGTGPVTSTSWAPCTTWARSMSQPGRSSDGASVSCRVGATTAKLGITCSPAVSSVCRRSVAPIARW